MTALASIIVLGTLKKSNNTKFIIVGLISCILIYYLKDLSVALGKTDRMSLTLATWMPIIIIGIFSSIGILQINENKFLTVLLFLSLQNILSANELDIKAKNITIDKNNKVTIFEKDVEVKDQFGNLIKADYVQFNKETNFLQIKGNIISKDLAGNIFKGNKATYDNNKQIFKSFGASSFQTSKGHQISTSNFILDNKNSYISSKEKTKNYRSR